MQLRRSRIKHKSSKQAKLERQHRQPRTIFLSEFQQCWFCGNTSTEVHEIANGNGIRNLAFAHRAAWAASCNRCNFHELTDKTKWPIERQLAVKLINDPAFFDLPAICEMRGRAATAIVIVDIVPYLAWQ